MSRRDEYLDAMVRHLGAAYYQALRGDASAAEVGKAVRQVDEQMAQENAAAQQTEFPAASRRSGPWQVSDVMTTHVVSVTESASYKQVAQLLHSRGLTALPVVSGDGRVVGIVSEADLLRKQERREHPGWPAPPGSRAKSEARTAGELMSSPAVTIGPDALVGRAARLMNTRHIKRLPVVAADGTLVGIVSRADLLTVFLRSDAEITAEAEAVLTDILLADADAVQVSVHDGVVVLNGELGSDQQVSTAVRLIREIDGVVGVTSHLTARPPEGWPGGGYHLPG